MAGNNSDISTVAQIFEDSKNMSKETPEIKEAIVESTAKRMIFAAEEEAKVPSSIIGSLMLELKLGSLQPNVKGVSIFSRELDPLKTIYDCYYEVESGKEISEAEGKYTSDDYADVDSKYFMAGTRMTPRGEVPVLRLKVYYTKLSSSVANSIIEDFSRDFSGKLTEKEIEDVSDYMLAKMLNEDQKG
jgi:hypothetical protein